MVMSRPRTHRKRPGGESQGQSPGAVKADFRHAGRFVRVWWCVLSCSSIFRFAVSVWQAFWQS